MAEPIKFGTDGWRGIIAWDFTFENVRRCAQALADFINQNLPSDLESKTRIVAVGYDRRFLSDRFAADIASILKLNKIDVALLDGPVTTPVISALTYTKFWLGIMVTASHNPPHYNGIKIKMAGGAAPGRLCKEVEALIDQKTVLYIPGHNVEPEAGLEKIYFKYIASHVNMKKALSLKGKVAVDYMHGSGAGYLQRVLPPARVIAINENADPDFGGIQPEPKDETLEALKKAVPSGRCIMGIAFDGDGDRVALVDEKGVYLTPCIVSAIVLNHLIKYKKLKGKVLQCVSMGYLNKRIARAAKMEFEEVPVGFKYVAERTQLEDVAFGAEESGGYCWKGIMPERDGLLLALFVMEIMAARGLSLSGLCKEIEKQYGLSCYLRRDVPLSKPADKNSVTEKLKRKLPKKILGRNVAQILDFDGLKIILDNDDWLMIRPSGTEPVLRLYSETADKKQTEAFLDFGAKLLIANKI
ncbi:MAG: phosphoglucomutase/phosphomannomutase family protein [Elusimicrobiota bacterium]|jgi:phosphomannomutase|nr:phosphoglucomutase/phosphomannomutase family protein [Elusimicrobiota bacterium]